MITLIVLLWMAIQLNAPLWVIVLIVFGLTVQTLEMVLKFVEQRLEKKLERLTSGEKK